jgi:hypothetical protein
VFDFYPTYRKENKCQQIVSKTLHFLFLSLNKVTSGFFSDLSNLETKTLNQKIKNQFPQFSVFGSSNWDWRSGWERCDYTDWHSFRRLLLSEGGAWLRACFPSAPLPYLTFPLPLPFPPLRK